MGAQRAPSPSSIRNAKSTQCAPEARQACQGQEHVSSTRRACHMERVKAKSMQWARRAHQACQGQERVGARSVWSVSERGACGTCQGEEERVQREPEEEANSMQWAQTLTKHAFFMPREQASNTGQGQPNREQKKAGYNSLVSGAETRRPKRRLGLGRGDKKLMLGRRVNKAEPSHLRGLRAFPLEAKPSHFHLRLTKQAISKRKREDTKSERGRESVVCVAWSTLSIAWSTLSVAWSTPS